MPPDASLPEAPSGAVHAIVDPRRQSTGRLIPTRCNAIRPNEESFERLNLLLLVELIEADRYLPSSRIRMSGEIVAKFGAMGPKPPPPTRSPTPEERDPGPKLRRRR